MSKNRVCKVPEIAALVLAVVAAASTLGQAQTYTDLYNFGTNSGDPLEPESPGIIAQGRDGNLYATAPGGGANDYGATFRITPDGELTVTHSFDGTEGGSPLSGLTLGTDGSFYGSTHNLGTVFKVTDAGDLTKLHGVKDPVPPPVEGLGGNFYGTATVPGCSSSVYRITPSGKLTTVYQFDDSACLDGPLVLGLDGNFYGMEDAYSSNKTYSAVFRITPSGLFSVIATLTREQGYNVLGGLIQGDDGKFYGTASSGGANNGGTIFRVSRTGKVKRLYSFTGTTDGGFPQAGLVQATDGNFYGVAAGDGFSSYGTIFRITPSGIFSVLHTFDNLTGAYPDVPLIQHSNGILYGTTFQGGLLDQCHAGCGVFFSLDVGLAPFVSFVGPLSSGKVGNTIQMLGQGFTGTSAVSFNGTAASYTINSDTYLTAIVPVGATTGFVTVTTPSGTLTSNEQFVVKP